MNDASPTEDGVPRKSGLPDRLTPPWPSQAEASAEPFPSFEVEFPPPRKRWRPRFSLQTLVLVVTLSALSFAGASQLARAETATRIMIGVIAILFVPWLVLVLSSLAMSVRRIIRARRESRSDQIS